MQFSAWFPYRSWMKSVALMVLLLLVGTAGVACTKKNPEACCTTQEDCDAFGLPLGTDCAEGLTCLFNRCTETSCQTEADCPTTLPHCGADGQCFECEASLECSGVCSEGQCVPCSTNEECGEGFCAAGSCDTAIVPRYLPDICDTLESRDLVLSTSFDTSVDLLCSAIAPQSDGTEICVVHANTITVPTSDLVQVSGSRALALVADQDLAIAGALEIDANDSTNGAGGGLSSSGGTPTNSLGGGGAGFATDGGHGGAASGDGGAANGGPATTDPADLPSLVGGIRGSGADGGGGGGAATLISCRGTIRVDGRISVSGGGGAGATLVNPTTIQAGGHGGGSGGYIVLQGVGIEITGALFANGGSGGGSPFTNLQGTFTQPGSRGLNGTHTTSPANGGRIGGGTGGALDNPAGVGRAGVGAGGGSIGFLQTYTPSGKSPSISAATTSPDVSANRELESK